MFLKPDSMRKRSLAVHGPLKNWGKGTNKAVGRGGGGQEEFLSEYVGTQNVGTLTTARGGEERTESSSSLY